MRIHERFSKWCLLINTQDIEYQIFILIILWLFNEK